MSLYAYIVRRLLLGCSVVVALSILVFFSLHLAPGDPLSMLVPPDVMGNASPAYIAQLRHEMGLDQPLLTQYREFVVHIVTLNLGHSLRSNQPIGPQLISHYFATIELAVAAMIFAVALGLVTGVLSAVHRDTWVDHTARATAFAGISLPSFWQGLILILVFSYYLRWLPISGRGGPIWTADGLRHLILPAVTLGTGAVAVLTRLVRSAMLDVLHEDYVRTARAKGLSERVVIYRHALKNALIPVITIIGLQFGGFLAGAVVVETVFSWPGIGQFMINAILGDDFPVVQVSALFIAATFVVVNLATDVVYTYLDPRLRFQ